MLQSCYKYSPSVEAMGNERSTESLFMTNHDPIISNVANIYFNI
jgi:hypothetical protein